MHTILRNLYKKLLSIHDILYSTYNYILKKLTELRLKNRPELVYTSDWTSAHYANWENWFKEYSGKENLRYLEIGSHEGRSLIWFLNNVLTHPTGKLTAIDLMTPKTEPYLKHNIKLADKSGKISLLQGRSQEILPTLEEESFDIIYIDGSHRSMNVLCDTIYSWQLLKKNGLLLLDDYLLNSELPKHLGPKYAIDLFLKHFKDEYELLHKDQQVLLRKSSRLIKS